METLVRTAVLRDLAALRELYRRSSLSNERDRASLLAHPDALVWSDLALREQRTRVAVRDRQLAGFATTLDVHPRLELEDLFVDPDWMRRGVARDLILDAIATAQRRGVGRIEVTANIHALDFYESVGFVHDMPIDTPLGSGMRMHLDTST